MTEKMAEHLVWSKNLGGKQLLRTISGASRLLSTESIMFSMFQPDVVDPSNFHTQRPVSLVNALNQDGSLLVPQALVSQMHSDSDSLAETAAQIDTESSAQHIQCV